MGLIIAAVAGLLGYLLTVDPGGRGAVFPPRPWHKFAVSLGVYVVMVAVIFAVLLQTHCNATASALQMCLAALDRQLSFYVVAALAVASFTAGSFTGRRNGAHWWLLACWPAPLIIAKLLAA